MESAVTPLMVAPNGAIIAEGIFRYRVMDSPAFTPAEVGPGLPLGCAELFPACLARLSDMRVEQVTVIGENPATLAPARDADVKLFLTDGGQ